MTKKLRSFVENKHKEITDLRKSGKLDEALILINELTAKELDDIWTKRAISWVYYDSLKKYSNEGNSEQFLSFLNKIKDLNLADDEKMLFDNLPFVIFSMINKSFKNAIDVVFLDKMFEIIKNFPFTKENTTYSVLFKAFHKGKEEWNGYVEFVNWWRIENFIKEDYLPFELENGKNIMSLVEQAYIGYAKKLIQRLDNVLSNEMEKENTLKLTNDFLWKLSNLIVIHPEYKYPSYYQAKLLIATGGDDVLKAIKPFALKMKSQFWVWDLIADIFSNGDSRKMACLCKALTLKTDDDFLIKVRKKLLSILIENKHYPEAKKEIESIEKTISKNGWKIDSNITQLKTKDWYLNANIIDSNNKFYITKSKEADLILLGDIPSEIITIKFINEHREILNYINNKKVEGYFNYHDIIKNPSIGDVYNVKLKAKGKEGFQELFFAEKVAIDQSTVIETFKGEINITENGFGFIDNIFFPKSFIEKNHIAQSQFLEGSAITTWNEKKKIYGKVVLNINLIEVKQN